GLSPSYWRASNQHLAGKANRAQYALPNRCLHRSVGVARAYAKSRTTLCIQKKFNTWETISMIVICHHCAFVYFLNARRRCPLCGTPARLTGYPLVRDWPDKRLVDRERAPAVDLVMERLFGSMYRSAEYPMICAAASVVNLAGR